MVVGWDIDQFWDRTPYQLDLAIKAHKQRLETQHELTAWACANLMNCWVKEKITVNKLLGKKSNRIDLTGASKEEVKAYYNSKLKGKVDPIIQLLGTITPV